MLDGANISMALCGLSSNDAEDVALWHAKIMLPIAEKTGAAVFANDHVPKNNSSYSGFAIGSQHKIAGLTGASFTMEKMVPFGRGRHGVATVRVGDKDREGFVHEIGTDDGQPDGMLVGELHVDAEGYHTMVELRVPSAEIAAAVADKRAKRKDGGAVRDVAYEMEVVSDYWREAGTDPKQRTQNKTIEWLPARQAGRGCSMSARSPTPRCGWRCRCWSTRRPSAGRTPSRTPRQGRGRALTPHQRQGIRPGRFGPFLRSSKHKKGATNGDDGD